jgi:hypothetical protein
LGKTNTWESAEYEDEEGEPKESLSSYKEKPKKSVRADSLNSIVG